MTRPKFDRAMAEAAEHQYEMQLLYQRVFDGPDGKRVLDDILNRICRQKAFVMSTNPMAVYIQGTRHDIAQAISNMVDGRVDQKNDDEGQA